MTAAIPYSSPRIFDSWTGNQFDLGESGDRLRVTKTSGRALTLRLGPARRNAFERLGKVAHKYAGAFPLIRVGTQARSRRTRRPTGWRRSWLQADFDGKGTRPETSRSANGSQQARTVKLRRRGPPERS